MDDKTVVLNGDIPRFLKLIMVFIDRVGFPVLAFLLMFYISYTSITKMTVAITENAIAVREFKISTEDFQRQVIKDHSDLETGQDNLGKMVIELQKYSYGYQDFIHGRRTEKTN
jgi:hypothetical protein